MAGLEEENIRPVLPLSINKLSSFHYECGLSPVTDLSFNLSGLSTSSLITTPKRRISWSSCTPNHSILSLVASDQSLDNSTESNSPKTQEKLLRDVNCECDDRKIIRRICTFPLCATPKQDKENIPYNPSDHVPGASVECTSKLETGSTILSNSDLPDSGYCSSQLEIGSSNMPSSSSHYTTVRSSLFVDDNADEFLEVFGMEKLNDNCNAPINITSLLTKPLIHPITENNPFDNKNHSKSHDATDKKKKHSGIRRCLSLMSECDLQTAYVHALQAGTSVLGVHLELLHSDDEPFLVKPARKIFVPLGVLLVKNRGKLIRTACAGYPSFGQKWKKQHSTSCDNIDNTKNLFTYLICNKNNEDATNCAKETKPVFKRPDPPKDIFSPIQSKRRKSVPLVPLLDNSSQLTSKKPLLQRSHSETEAIIKKALQKSIHEPDLIGDFSKPFALPLVKGKHEDVKTISADTLKDLLAGQYSDSVDSFTIVDCRYPYEYDGGHIKGAKNIYTKEGAIEQFLSNENVGADGVRHIIVFHCEFSSERGPNLYRFLRNMDRETNKDRYPLLHHPEIYVLHGGYKEFYEHFKEYCQPQKYKPMFDKEHEKELRHFRAKSKSWNGECKGRMSLRPGLKF